MKRQFKQAALVVLDIIFINMSIFVAYFIKFQWLIPPAYLKIYFKSFIPITIIMIASFYVFKLYKSIWRYASIDELNSVIFAVSAGVFSSFLYGLIIGYRLPYSAYFVMWALTIMSSGGIRFLRRVIGNIEMVPSEILKKSKRTLIVGAGDAGAMVVREMKKHPEMGYIPVGFIDDEESKKGKVIHGVSIIGQRNDIIKIAIDKDIDEILIAMPSSSNNDIREIISICNETGCKLKTLPGIYELIDEKVTISQIRDVEIYDLLGRDTVELNIDEIAGYVKNKVVMVTGGGGSIGSEICRQMTRFNPKKLIILDNYENGAYDLQMELNKKAPYINKEVIIASVREKDRLDEIFNRFKPQVIFHAAAHKHVPLMEGNPKEAVKNNIVGTLNLAECADKYGVEKFVQISTDKAVNPTNIMGATKRVCEMIIQSINKESKTEFVAVRFGNVLGSNGSIIPLWKKQIAAGGPVTVTHPEITRFFMTIPEAAQLVIQAGAMAKGGEIFILDMGKPVKMVKLARDLIKLSGFEPEKEIQIQFIGLRPGEKLYEELLMNEEGIITTKHKKIFIGKPGDFDFSEVKKKIRILQDKLEFDDEVLFDAVEEMVPTYNRKK